MLIIFPSGTYYCFKGECGYYFWGVHGRDAIWHLAVVNVSFNKFPFIAPTFAGENLYGYNFLLDFIIFLLTKLGIPAIISYFKLLPIIWFIFFTGLLINLARKIKDTPFFVGLFLFFSYFAGSFSYFLTLYHYKTINGSSTLLPQPIMHAMSNLPFAFSLLFFLALLIFIKDKKMDTKKLLMIGIIIFIILGLKFYGGVIAIFMVFTYVILVSPDLIGTHPESNNDSRVPQCYVVVTRITKRLATLSIFIILGIFFFYDPTRSFKTGSVFGWAPFALVHTITESPNQFYLQKLTDARYYLKQFGVGPRLLAIETLNLLVFLFFYLGTRIFGLIYLAVYFIKSMMSFLRKQESRKLNRFPIRSGMTLINYKLDRFNLTVILTIFFSIFLTVTLVQKGVWWNTIQFFFYAIFLSTIYLSRLTYDLFIKKQKFLVVIGFIIIFLSIPTSYDLIWHFLKVSKPAFLPKEEIEALAFLKKQPDGVVLNPIYDNDLKSTQKYLPLNHYKDSSYIAAFSNKQLYLAEIQTLGVTNVSFDNRLERIQKMDCSILKEVDYIYEIKGILTKRKILSVCKAQNVKKIYDNQSVSIYSFKDPKFY